MDITVRRTYAVYITGPNWMWAIQTHPVAKIISTGNPTPEQIVSAIEASIAPVEGDHFVDANKKVEPCPECGGMGTRTRRRKNESR